MGFLDRLLGRKAAVASAKAIDDAFGDDLDIRSALIVARWTDTQRAEYVGYGAEVLHACLALEDGRFHDADRRFSALLEEFDDPVFLLYDAARARLLAGNPESAEHLLEQFVSKAGDRASPDQRLEVGVELATIAAERGDDDRAIARLGKLVEAMPRDPRAYLALGRFLRSRGFAEEALDVYRGFLSSNEVADTAMLEESGLCELALGHTAEAERFFDEVIRRAKCTCGVKVPESTLTALASIYETTGRHAKAIEMLRNAGQAPSGACSSNP